MADMMFLRLKGIDGEAPIGDSQKAISIANFSHNVSTPIAALRPNVGADARSRRGPVEHGEFQITKALDKTSSKLFSACCNGVIFENAVVFVCSQDRNTMLNTSKIAPFFTITMTDVIISNFSYQCAGQWPMEALSLHYTSIGWKVEWIDPDEENDTATKTNLEPVGWDGEIDKAATIDVPSDLSWQSGLL